MQKDVYLIVGYGLSAKSVIDFCIRNNIAYYVYEDLPDNFTDRHLSFDQVLANNFTRAIVSPGFAPHHKIINFLYDKAVNICTDIDLMLENYNIPVIAVTGTNGKSTVTSWISEWLINLGLNYPALGNIGRPVLNITGLEDGLVVELSSAQLYYMNINNIKKIDLAIIMAIGPDHLDWHGSFQDYFSSKLKLLNAKKKILHLSLVNYANENDFIFSDSIDKIYKFDCQHYWRRTDRLNLSAVLSVISVLGLKIDNIINLTFLPYRAEKFKHKYNCIVINDSKATNLHAVNDLLNNVNEIYPDRKHLILLGGIYKENFIMPNVKPDSEIWLFGDLIKHVDIDCKKYKSLKNLMSDLVVYMYNNQDNIIVFAPGGSSFDEFKNYFDRGKFFNEFLLNV